MGLATELGEELLEECLELGETLVGDHGLEGAVVDTAFDVEPLLQALDLALIFGALLAKICHRQDWCVDNVVYVWLPAVAFSSRVNDGGPAVEDIGLETANFLTDFLQLSLPETGWRVPITDCNEDAHADLRM